MPVNVSVREGDGYIVGTFGVRERDAVADMPGRRRWRSDGSFWFEATRANIEHLRSKLPEATWHGAGDRLAALEEVERMERRAADRVAAEPVRFDWKTEPFDHQRKAFAFARSRPFFGLFMEMGTGKSKVGADVMAAKWSAGEIDAVVIVAPNGVHAQWAAQQIPTHLPDWVSRKVHVHRAGKAYPRWALDSSRDTSALLVLCINAEALSHASGREAMARFMTGRRVFLIVDESIRFKDYRAARTKALLSLAEGAVARCIMSGAPITKGVEDLYAQLRILSPDILGHSSYSTFVARYCVTAPAYRGAPRGAVKITGYRNMEELIERVDAHTFRVTKAECLDLPPKLYTTREVELTPEQKTIYRQLKTALLTDLSEGRVSAPNAAVRLMRLQQVVCGHVPIVDDEGNIVAIKALDNNRVQAVMDLLEEDDQPMIVWARFKHDVKVLGEAFTAAGVSWVSYTGDTPQSAREGLVADFMEGRARVFLGNPAAAGTGLNLQRASRMVYYSNSFNADYRWQSEDRAHRIGQRNNVTIIDLVAPGTLDAQIIRALKNRADVARMVLDDPRSVLEEPEPLAA